jgi:nucleoside phosphorylase
MVMAFIAAEAFELRPLVKRASRPVRHRAGIQFFMQGELNGADCYFAADGMGPANALAALKACRSQGEVDAVVSIGLCGALLVELKIGDIVAACGVLAGEKKFPVRLPENHLPHRVGVVVSVNRVISSSTEKGSLGITGACAVEMEAGGLAEFCSAHNLPFFCVKAVSDELSTTLPLDFNLLRDHQGRLLRSAVVQSALRSPCAAIPGLWRLRADARRAVESLAQFLASSRFPVYG